MNHQFLEYLFWKVLINLFVIKILGIKLKLLNMLIIQAHDYSFLEVHFWNHQKRAKFGKMLTHLSSFQLILIFVVKYHLFYIRLQCLLWWSLCSSISASGQCLSESVPHYLFYLLERSTKFWYLGRQRLLCLLLFLLLLLLLLVLAILLFRNLKFSSAYS